MFGKTVCKHLHNKFSIRDEGKILEISIPIKRKNGGQFTIPKDKSQWMNKRECAKKRLIISKERVEELEGKNRK